MLHIYTGSGKGKTTAAVGLAVRAAGAGMRVLFCQFLKAGNTSEAPMLERLGIRLMHVPEMECFTFAMDPQQKQRCCQAHHALLEAIEQELAGGDYQLVVLDEILDAVNTGMLEQERVTALVRRSHAIEVVLTGRSPAQELMDAADYISQITEIRHPYRKGVKARKGIEY